MEKMNVISKDKALKNVIIIIGIETVFYFRPTSIPGARSGTWCRSPWEEVLLAPLFIFLAPLGLHQGSNYRSLFLYFVLLESNMYSMEIHCVIICL